MRIAVVAPVWFTVPPAGYGGIEAVVALLADGLAERGHDVTLYASGGSTTKARLVSPFPEPPDPSLLGNVWFDSFHTLSVYLQVEEVDVVHDHSGIIGPALAAVRAGSEPVVHTLHGPWTEQARRYYSLIDDRIHLVAISEAQRSDNPDVRYAATVHNGIDLGDYPLRTTKDDFLLFIGRANPDKGPEVAIEIARRVGLPLKMIIKRNEPPERLYWDESVAPYLNDQVEVLENVPHATKAELLGRARALLFPIRWPEPFGLVMVEAMACGTPVIARNMGAAVEVVGDGRSGALCQSTEEMVAAAGRLDRFDPLECRSWVSDRFSASAMVGGYERLFQQLIS